MKRILIPAIMALAVISTASAKTLVNVDRSGVAIRGYDPVAYFTDKKAVKGNAQLQSNVGGVIYYFASAENKAAFDADAAKYQPQFGGFCAWAVSRGYTAPIDPNAFQIVNGRLLLQVQPESPDGLQPGHRGQLEESGCQLAVDPGEEGEGIVFFRCEPL